MSHVSHVAGHLSAAEALVADDDAELAFDGAEALEVVGAALLGAGLVIIELLADPEDAAGDRPRHGRDHREGEGAERDPGRRTHQPILILLMSAIRAATAAADVSAAW